MGGTPTASPSLWHSAAPPVPLTRSSAAHVISAILTLLLAFAHTASAGTTHWLADYTVRLNLSQAPELFAADPPGLAPARARFFREAVLPNLMLSLRKTQLEHGYHQSKQHLSSQKVEELLARDVLEGHLRGLDFVDVISAEFQEEVRLHWLTGSHRPPLELALFLHSLPLVVQQGIAQDCPMAVASAYLLVAEMASYTESPETALEKYEIARELAEATRSSQALGSSPDNEAESGWAWEAGRHRVHTQLHRQRSLHQTVDVVIARCNEELTWLRGEALRSLLLDESPHVRLARLWVYNKCGDLPPRGAAELEDLLSAAKPRRVEMHLWTLPNHGMESFAYATFLALHDDGKGDVVFFLQGSPLGHTVPSLLEVAARSVLFGSFPQTSPEGRGAFLHLNLRRFLGGANRCVAELLEELIPGGHGGSAWAKTATASYCCSQFVVSRAAISQASEVADHSARSLRYARARELLAPSSRGRAGLSCSQDDEHDNRPGISTSALFEHFWHVLFGREPYLPMRRNDAGLPLPFRSEGADPVFGNLVLEGLRMGLA